MKMPSFYKGGKEHLVIDGDLQLMAVLQTPKSKSLEASYLQRIFSSVKKHQS